MEVKFDIENPLTNSSTNLSHLLLLESDHMVSPFHLQHLHSFPSSLSLRHDTISLISEFCGSFDSFISYLAVNYLDRFFSNHGMPPWVVRLLAISCVSLAAKMMKTEFSLSVFQTEEGLIFDSQTIERMEMLILGALKWRMRSITPFAFLEFFTTFFKLKDPPLMQALKGRALEIIFKAQNEIKVLEFKPSIVAASAVLCAANELFPIQFPSFLNSINSCSYVDKDKLEGCINVIEGKVNVMDGGYETLLFHDDDDDGDGDGDGVKCKSASVLSSSSTLVNVVLELDHQMQKQKQWSNSKSSDLISNIMSMSQSNNKRKFTASDSDSDHHSDTIQHQSDDHDHQQVEERESNKRQQQIHNSNKIGSSSGSSISSSSNITVQLSQLQRC